MRTYVLYILKLRRWNCQMYVQHKNDKIHPISISINYAYVRILAEGVYMHEQLMAKYEHVNI